MKFGFKDIFSTPETGDGSGDNRGPDKKKIEGKKRQPRRGRSSGAPAVLGGQKRPHNSPGDKVPTITESLRAITQRSGVTLPENAEQILADMRKKGANYRAVPDQLLPYVLGLRSPNISR